MWTRTRPIRLRSSVEGRRCSSPVGFRLRQKCKYLNNVVEQDHRMVKKRTWLTKGYGSFLTAGRTLQKNRSRAYDSEGQGEMGDETGCNRAGHFHCRAVWHRRVTASIAVGTCSNRIFAMKPHKVC